MRASRLPALGRFRQERADMAAAGLSARLDFMISNAEAVTGLRARTREDVAATRADRATRAADLREGLRSAHAGMAEAVGGMMADNRAARRDDAARHREEMAAFRADLAARVLSVVSSDFR